VIRDKQILNPNDPKDAELINKMLEKSDEESEDEDFTLYLSDNEKIEDLLPNDKIPDDNTDSISFTQEEMCELPRTQVVETALINDPPKLDKIQTRSQTAKIKDNLQTKLYKQNLNDEIKELENKNDSSDKGKDTENDDAKEESDKEKLPVKPTIINV